MDKDYYSQKENRTDTKGHAEIMDNEAKQAKVSFCCTPSQKRMIQESAEARRMSMSEYICRQLFNRG